MFSWIGIIVTLGLTASFAAAADQNHYEVLGVPKTASKADLKARYRKLAMELRPDITKDQAKLDEFARVKDAYDVLKDDDQRAFYDRNGRVRAQPTTTPRWPEADVTDLRDFFRSASGESSSFDFKPAPDQARVAVDLSNLNLSQIENRSPSYVRWRKRLIEAVRAGQKPSVHVGAYHQMLVTGAAQSGRNAHGAARLTYLFGLIYLLVPAETRSPIDGALIIGLSPLIWQSFGTCIAFPTMDEARRCVNQATEDILAAPAPRPLVNAIVAFDLLDAEVGARLTVFGPPRTYERLIRETTLQLARPFPALLKGWLFRALQNLEGDDRFFGDLRGRPKLWIEPLRELVAETGDSPLVQQRASALLTEIESQSFVRTARARMKIEVGWTCELALANFTAFTKPRARWAKE